MQRQSTPSGLSASEDYQPPNPHDLAALLSEDTLSRSRDLEFSSRESTPFIMEIPLGGDYWQSIAQEARVKLEAIFGKPAVDDVRQSITYTHYWKTEAKHYAEYWDLIRGKSSDHFDILRPATTDNIRQLISDVHYWETEAMHYRRYSSSTSWSHRAVQNRKPSITMTQQSAIHKRKKVPRSSSRIMSEDGPVSSRLRRSTKLAKLVHRRGDLQSRLETACDV